MKEHISKEDIINKAISSFQDKTDKLVPNIATDLDALKILFNEIINYSFAYKDIVWVNKLRVLERKIQDNIKIIEGSDIEILCNWNPEFRKEVQDKIAKAQTTDKKKS